MRIDVSLRVVGLMLIAVGGLACLAPFAVLGYGMWEESQLTQSWSQQFATAPTTPADGAGRSSAGPDNATPDPQRADALPALFAIRVAKIGYYAAVRQGVSLDVLATGPGHYPTTAMPGKPGLVAIAAHNTFWIPFGKLEPGDAVELETRYGKFNYRITGTRIVEADDRTVLAQTTDPRLVLTTCWPLWAGNLAPQRLAIFARQV